MDELRLLLIADDPLARAGLAALLADLDGCLLINQISSAALTADSPLPFSNPQPDVIIWDLGWDPADFPDWQEITIPIVALLADESGASEAWAAGGRALLPRDVDAETLLAAARAATQGLLVLDPQLAADLLPAAESDLAPIEELTPRESEVLQLLAEGLTNKAIAQQLHISNHTVKFHVNAILRKLRAQSRTEAVVKATRMGLILL